MSTFEEIKQKLQSDPDSCGVWVGDGWSMAASYDQAEIRGYQLTMMVDDIEDVFVVVILPGDESGHYDAWVRRMGHTEMVHLYNGQAADLELLKAQLLEKLPDYL